MIVLAGARRRHGDTESPRRAIFGNVPGAISPHVRRCGPGTGKNRDYIGAYATLWPRALARRVYGGCAAVNCDRPPAWVESHHKKPWSKGGRTDLKDGLPLCPPHHQMADHPETWTMHTLPDGTVRFHRRT